MDRTAAEKLRDRCWAVLASNEEETLGGGEARAEALVMDEEKEDESLALDALMSEEAELEAVIYMTNSHKKAQICR